MATGWIKLHRSIEGDADYFEGPFDRMRCWIDLLLLAEIEPRNFRKRGQIVRIGRGDIAKSVRELAGRWQRDVNTVQKWLREFIERGQIEIIRNNVVNVIHIINYEKYQDCQRVNPTEESAETEGIHTQIHTQIQTQTHTQIHTPLKNIRKKELKKESLSLSQGACVCARGDGEPPPAGDEEHDVFSSFLDSQAWQSELKMFRSLEGSQRYFESYCMKVHVDRERGRALLHEFMDECRLGMKTHVSLADLMSHFLNWTQTTRKARPNERNTDNSASNGASREKTLGVIADILSEPERDIDW